MTDELLPPDPTKDGFYWLAHSSGRPRVWEWCADGAEGSWQRDSAVGSAHEMATWGYLLASPHPIPGPPELDALHAFQDEMANEIAITRKLRDLYTLHGAEWRRRETIAAIYERCAAMLRAALGIKP